MIIKENRIEKNRYESLRGYIDKEEYIEGYFLTIHDLAELMRDFQVDNFDGFVSNDHAYIEEWLKKHERIVK